MHLLPAPSAALLLGALVLAAAPFGVTAQEAPTPGTRVVFLGTGTPNAEPDRSGPSLAVVVNGTPYLVDAGPGVVRRANAARAAGIEGLAPPRLATVFLTHLHSDHTVGLPDLLLTPWVLGRERPLTVVGPPGTRHMAETVREAWREDIAMRVEGIEPANDGGHAVDARDVEPGLVYEDANVRVYAFLVSHGSWRRAYGYRFVTADRTVVVSGDATFSPEVARQCDGCDILVHEAYSHDALQRRTPEWQRYHAAFHTSGPDLGRLAAQARPRLLVLTHTLLWGATHEALLQEVRGHYAGRVVVADDLDVY